MIEPHPTDGNRMMEPEPRPYKAEPWTGRITAVVTVPVGVEIVATDRCDSLAEAQEKAEELGVMMVTSMLATLRCRVGDIECDVTEVK